MPAFSIALRHCSMHGDLAACLLALCLPQAMSPQVVPHLVHAELCLSPHPELAQACGLVWLESRNSLLLRAGAGLDLSHASMLVSCPQRLEGRSCHCSHFP